MTVQIDGVQLRTSKGAVVSFEYAIKEVAEIDGVLIVVLDVPAGRSLTENVFGVSHAGDILWQIEQIAETATDPVNWYTGILPTVKLYNWNGVSAEIAVHTGRIITKWMGK